jgi:hypothetical protein
MGTRSRWFIVASVVAVSLACLQPMRAAASAEGSFQRTLQVTGPISVDLTTGSGSVSVRTGSSSQVEITGHIKATNSRLGIASEPVRGRPSHPAEWR